jgi:integrating conjugative element protein (TIGR03759 family)
VQGLDIYLVGQMSDEAVRTWARRHGVTPALVRGRRVTLNHDHGNLARLAPGLTTTVPYAVRKRGKNDYARIDLSGM